MFAFTQRYLAAHYDAETGETSGSEIILQICLRYQRARWWWIWHKEQPSVTSLRKALYYMTRSVLFKASY
jgi:hypothetical protein